jgi:hypothetical protein
MTMTAPADAAPAAPPQAAKLDDVMLAMDVVDTLRHRELLVQRELSEEVREDQLVERLRALYKSQGIEVPDRVIEQGVKALKESRFVYTPAPPSFGRTMATLWVKRDRFGKALMAAVLALGLIGAGSIAYNVFVTAPAQRELAETLPRQLTAAHQAVLAEAQVDTARTRANAILTAGQTAAQRGDREGARTAIAELDGLAAALRQEFTLRIAGRPEDQTGFWRDAPGFNRGRTYYVVVDAIDPRGTAVQVPVRNAETNRIENVSRFAVAVPEATFQRVREDKARNGLVQNNRMAEKRRGFLEPEFRMPALEGRITRW